MTTRPAAQRRHFANSPFKPRPEPAIEEFAVEDRVSHDHYGLGRVIDVEEGAVVVDFGSQRVRVPSPFRKMEKL